MKRTSLVIVLICASFLAGVVLIVACKKNSSNKTNSISSPTSTKPKNAARAYLQDFPQAISTTDANTLISNYLNDRNLIGTTSFQYSAATLLKFMQESDSIVQLHMLLGEKTVNNTTTLTLIFCGVDKNGNHIYITDNNVNYALDECMPCPQCVVMTLENPNGATAYVNAAYQQNRLLSSAQSMVAAYQARNTKNSSASTFLTDAKNLEDYITNAPNIVNLQFFLAQTSQGVLSLVIAGIDKNNNHIYISNNNNTYAFDMAIPCPTCNSVANNGVNFE